MKTKISIQSIFSTILLIAVILLGNLYFIVSPKETFSEEENRVLEKLPRFTFSTISNGTFMDNMENYVGDHFILRKFFVSMNTEVQLLLGRRDLAADYSRNPPEGGIYYGKNGHIYEVLLPDRSGVFDDNIKAFHQFARKTGVPVWMLPVPSGAQEQQDNLPYSAPSEDQRQKLRKIKKDAPENFHVIDIFGQLSLKTGKDYYYKTDHHWTAYGAFTGYQELAKAMGIQPMPESAFLFKKTNQPFYGTLYSKAINAWQQSDTFIIPYPKAGDDSIQSIGSKKHSGIYWEEYLNRKDQYSVFLGGNQAVTVITNPKATDGKILILKDSYANSMIPFLSQNYSEIHMIDLRYYNLDIYKYIKQNAIDKIAAVYSMKQLCDVSISNKLKR